jgi:hypothetical protein
MYLEGDVEESFRLKALAAPMIAGYRFTLAAEEEHTAPSRSGQYGDIDFLTRLAELTARVW